MSHLKSILEKYKTKAEEVLEEETVEIEEETVSPTYHMDDIKSVLFAHDISESVIDEIETALEEAAPSHLISLIDEAIDEFRAEATEDEIETLNKMFSEENAYESFIDMIFESDDDEDDDDEAEKKSEAKKNQEDDDEDSEDEKEVIDDDPETDDEDDD